MSIEITIAVSTYSPLIELIEARDVLINLIAQRGGGEEIHPQARLARQRLAEAELNPAPQHPLTPMDERHDAVVGAKDAVEPATDGASAKADPSKATEPPAPSPAPAKPRGRPAKPPVAKTYTIDEIRAVLVAKSAAGVEAVEKQRRMLQEMGYEKLSAVPIEKYSELMEKAQAL